MDVKLSCCCWLFVWNQAGAHTTPLLDDIFCESIRKQFSVCSRKSVCFVQLTGPVRPEVLSSIGPFLAFRTITEKTNTVIFLNWVSYFPEWTNKFQNVGAPILSKRTPCILTDPVHLRNMECCPAEDLRIAFKLQKSIVIFEHGRQQDSMYRAVLSMTYKAPMSSASCPPANVTDGITRR